MNKEKIIKDCYSLLSAYKTGLLGQTVMPEECNPGLDKMEREERIAYFTLPMALNYQRDSYKLWESVLKTYNDKDAKKIFDIATSANMDDTELRSHLLKYKIALQPNKHIATWKRIATTITENWGTLSALLEASNRDYLQLKQIVQQDHKKGFPYLSGPKIFNYWCFILRRYCGVQMKNAEFIEIAPDTHVTKCSVILGLISPEEADVMSKDQISARWRTALQGSGINPIDMHTPLWFWSKNNFKFKLPFPSLRT